MYQVNHYNENVIDYFFVEFFVNFVINISANVNFMSAGKKLKIKLDDRSYV